MSDELIDAQRIDALGEIEASKLQQAKLLIRIGRTEEKLKHMKQLYEESQDLLDSITLPNTLRMKTRDTIDGEEFTIRMKRVGGQVIAIGNPVYDNKVPFEETHGNSGSDETKVIKTDINECDMDTKHNKKRRVE